jgi:hypothetical protein
MAITGEGFALCCFGHFIRRGRLAIYLLEAYVSR